MRGGQRVIAAERCPRVGEAAPVQESRHVVRSHVIVLGDASEHGCERIDCAAFLVETCQHVRQKGIGRCGMLHTCEMRQRLLPVRTRASRVAEREPDLTQLEQRLRFHASRFGIRREVRERRWKSRCTFVPRHFGSASRARAVSTVSSATSTARSSRSIEAGTKNANPPSKRRTATRSQASRQHIAIRIRS